MGGQKQKKMKNRPKENLLEGIVKSVEVIHKPGRTWANRRFTRHEYYPAKIVVWATTRDGVRVWLDTILQAGDSMKVPKKVALYQRSYNETVGEKIKYALGDGIGFIRGYKIGNKWDYLKR